MPTSYKDVTDVTVNSVLSQANLEPPHLTGPVSPFVDDASSFSEGELRAKRCDLMMPHHGTGAHITPTLRVRNLRPWGVT